MDIPRLGVESELQLLAYPTATATSDPSQVCDLHHSSQQCWILNPLSEARNWTWVLMNASQVRFHWAMMGTPYIQLFWIHLKRWISKWQKQFSWFYLPILFFPFSKWYHHACIQCLMPQTPCALTFPWSQIHSNRTIQNRSHFITFSVSILIQDSINPGGIKKKKKKKALDFLIPHLPLHSVCHTTAGMIF